VFVDALLPRVPGGATLPCWDEPPDLFFAESPADVERAKAVCGDCAIRAACLAGAIERREPWGVWGGELIVAGRVVAHKRPRGRPPKRAANVLAKGECCSFTAPAWGISLGG
jgi:WhiB family redox-sensing transcriptional regulator